MGTTGSDPPRFEGDHQPLIDHAARLWEAEEENSRRHAKRTNLLLTLAAALLGLGAVRLGDIPDGVVWRSLYGFGMLMLAVGAIRLLAVSLGLDQEGEADKPGETAPDAAVEEPTESVPWLRRLWRGLLQALRKAGWLFARPLVLVARLLKWILFDFAAKQVSQPASSSLLMRIDREALTRLGIVSEPKEGSDEFVGYSVFMLTLRAATDLGARNSLEQQRIDGAQQWLMGGFALLVTVAVATFLVTHSTSAEQPEPPAVTNNSGYVILGEGVFDAASDQEENQARGRAEEQGDTPGDVGAEGEDGIQGVVDSLARGNGSVP